MEKSIEGLRADLAESPTIQGTYVGPTTDTERNLAEVLAGVVRVEQVSVDSHFFEDLGANSMVMAQFCARVRKRADLPSVSMKDVYQHPTIRSLATALADAAPTPSVASSVPASTEVGTDAAPTPVASSIPASTEVETPASVQVGQDSNDNWRACRPVQRRGAPWQTQSGGRNTRWES